LVFPTPPGVDGGKTPPFPPGEKGGGGGGAEPVWTISEIRKSNLGPFNP